MKQNEYIDVSGWQNESKFHSQFFLLKIVIDLVKFGIVRLLVFPLKYLLALTWKKNDNSDEIDGASNIEMGFQPVINLLDDAASEVETVKDSSELSSNVHEDIGKACTKQTFNRSILKQRSISESEDEVFTVSCNYLDSWPISEGDEDEQGQENGTGRKKSVSFSEFVDSTIYRKNSSVSTLHATLKNKRKRIKRKEEIRAFASANGHRRRVSSGSDAEDVKAAQDHCTRNILGRNRSSKSSSGSESESANEGQGRKGQCKRRARKGSAKKIEIDSSVGSIKNKNIKDSVIISPQVEESQHS